MDHVLERPWFSTLPPALQNLVEVAVVLYANERENPHEFADYSYIIFPMSKAYEGYIKRYLHELELISQRTFEGKRFRIGRALNPDVRLEQRDKYWLFDDIVHVCGEEIARAIWETWLECRNRVFHYFPLQNRSYSLEDVKHALTMIDNTITKAHLCQQKNKV